MGKRPYSVTNSEMSITLWGIGVLILLVVILNINGMRTQVQYTNPQLAGTFSFMIGLCIISMFFGLIGVSIPNYQITKYNLNPFMDRITNEDWIAWIRFTRDKRLVIHTVKKSSMGRTKGVVHGKKATVINNGDYTITLPNGNQAICVSDLISQNINLDENVGWNLVYKHFGGLIGFKAYEKAVDSKNLLFDETPSSDMNLKPVGEKDE